MKKTIMDSVMLSRFAKWAGHVFQLNLFKKKSCGASLCKSEKTKYLGSCQMMYIAAELYFPLTRAKKS